MRSFVIVIRSAYFRTQKRRNYAKSLGVNRSGSRPAEFRFFLSLVRMSITI